VPQPNCEINLLPRRLIAIGSKGSEMGEETKRALKEHPAAFAFSIFYAVSGMLFILPLLTVEPSLLHLGLIGILSLITAFGVFKMNRWSLWSAFVVFCLANAFSITLLLNPLTANLGLLFQGALIFYLILVWAATIYLTIRREELQ